MGQPYRIPRKAISCIADGIELPRAQTLSFSADLPFDDVSEFANEGIVERVYDIPDLTVTLTTFDSSAETLAVLAGEELPVDTSASMPPLLNVGNGFGNKTIYIGADAPAGTNSAFDTTGTDAVPIATEFLLHRKTEGATTIDECLHISKCSLTSWGLSWSLDGNFEQSYDFDATNIHRYVGVSAQYVHIAKAVPSATTRNIRLSTNLSTAYGSTPLAVIHNSNTYTSDAFFTTGSSTGAYSISFVADPVLNDYNEVRVVASAPHYSDPVFAKGDYIRVLYTKYPAGFGFGTLNTTYYPNLPAAIRGAHTEVYLYEQGGTSAQMKRIQSLDIDVPFDRKELGQFGDDLPYFQSLSLPLSIGLTINVILSDLRHWADAAGKGARNAFNTVYDSTKDLDLAFNALNTQLKCKIEIYKSRTEHTLSNLLTTYILSNLDFTGTSENYSGGDDATATLNFTTDRMTVVGYGVG